MRLALPLLLLGLAAPLAAADLTAVRVWPSYRSAESFERISEYFTGRENPSGQTLLRSQPDERDGFYFMARIKNRGPAALENVRVELNVVTPGSPDTKRFDFPATRVPRGNHVFQIGLTGTDWIDAAANPVAWQIRLLSADGQELLSEQSFLWSPRAKN